MQTILLEHKIKWDHWNRGKCVKQHTGRLLLFTRDMNHKGLTDKGMFDLFCFYLMAIFLLNFTTSHSQSSWYSLYHWKINLSETVSSHFSLYACAHTLHILECVQTLQHFTNILYIASLSLVSFNSCFCYFDFSLEICTYVCYWMFLQMAMLILLFRAFIFTT